MQPSILRMTTSAEISYDVMQEEVYQTLETSTVTVEPTGLECPDIVYSLEM